MDDNDVRLRCLEMAMSCFGKTDDEVIRVAAKLAAFVLRDEVPEDVGDEVA